MNTKLIERLRTRFKRMRHPEHFRMEQIAIKTDCGAAMCFIGHTLDLAGYRMRVKKELDTDIYQQPSRCDYDFINPATGRKIKNPYDKAAKLLGLDTKTSKGALQAKRLFNDFAIQTPPQAVEKLTELLKDNS